MALQEYIDPWKNIPFLFTDSGTVHWKGTPGVGDILFGLNAVHMLTHLARKKRDIPFTTMNVHWVHGPDHLHHFEDPETIIQEMEKGVAPQNYKKTLSILDRKQAIKTACQLANTNDIILIAGKGHETYQEINGVRYDFDDLEIVTELLQQLNK